jgi:hypothetical protein
MKLAESVAFSNKVSKGLTLTDYLAMSTDVLAISALFA